MPLRLAIGLLSGAAIAYQLLLMRLFSIMQWHHFAYMVISLALLGYGASGALLTLLRRPLLARFDSVFLSLTALFGLSAVGCFAAAQRLPLNPLEVMWDLRQLGILATVYLLLALPFVCAGGAVGLTLARFGDSIHRIYRADLVGAAAGAAAAIGALYLFRPATCLRLVALAGSLAGVVSLFGWAESGAKARRRHSSPRTLAVLLSAVVIGVSFLWPSSWLAPRMSEYKALTKTLEVPGTEIVAERSSPLGSFAAVRSKRIPFRIAPGLSFTFVGEIPEQALVFNDGEIATVVDGGNPDSNPEGEGSAYLDFLPSVLPYRLPGRPSDRPRVALIGSSALALALSHSASEVHVVEVNPQMSELVTEELADFSGRLYSDPRVRTYSVDARGFFARQGRFDLISLDVGDAGGLSAARSLRETFTYTLEAFELFLGSLTPGGVLAVGGEFTSPPRASLKLLATTAEALRRSDRDPLQHVVAIRSWNRFLILVKPSELTRAEVEAVRVFCEERAFDLAYYPEMSESEANRFHLLEQPELFRGALALLGPARETFLDNYKFRLAPATDDRPYFFHFFRWATLAELMELRTRGGAPLMDLGYVLLVAALPQAAVAGLLVILLPLRVARSSGGGTGRVGLYFLCLGLAFLFLEIAFIQRLTLFLAHPLSAAAVVLAGFLFFAGLGSGVSRRLDRFRAPWAREPIHLVVGAIVTLALGYLLLLPALLAHAIAWPIGAKIPLALLVIAPLAFLLGMPFPLGLRRVAASREDLVPWAWGVNGWASVLSAVLATLLAVQFGFSVVVAAACGLYLLAAGVAPLRRLPG